ncbi:hypothetical protein NO559_03095 [Dasania sp. GY-MA-18]|uniref:Uncharacterized protein n=1 Tax=Dasania phycosphaerae TaxID=2950436 RepID=A0A9J6RIJ6_9GAMM|nr:MULTISPECIES: hypothetical protein [Dasania]MCR8921741.1 hypothetical protein [Dasania sp. GY-MA-18]MCZ0864169.1 hypothetical protein [Dasania phycosphaerae]MCZ0867897.1 hypothetical protein [Dasania phycosphaerae]
MAGDYLLAWGSYVTAALLLLLLLWRMTAAIKLIDLRIILVILAAALLFTPVPVEPGSAYWAPAFMAALIDAVTIGAEAGIKRLWPILIVMLLLVVLSLIARVLRHRQKSAATPK